jgi:hypothetical protein
MQISTAVRIQMVAARAARRRGPAAIAALLLSASPAFTAENVLVRHIDTLLDFVGFVTANCVQHYEE